jgi:RNA polymerase sigma-70 factor (ECF subfamily)
MLDRTPAATCQLASRTRHVVRGVPTVADPDPSRPREVVAAFLAAARTPDFDALVSVLDPDVVFRIDTGGRTTRRPALLTGSADVAHHAASYGPHFAKLCRPALVNGGAAIIAWAPAGVIAVAGLTVVNARSLPSTSSWTPTNASC